MIGALSWYWCTGFSGSLVLIASGSSGDCTGNVVVELVLLWFGLPMLF